MLSVALYLRLQGGLSPYVLGAQLPLVFRRLVSCASLSKAILWLTQDLSSGDVISSLVLVSFPLYALRLTSSELPVHERRLIYALFASTILTLAACLAQAIFVAKMDRFATSYSAMLEVCFLSHFRSLPVVQTPITLDGNILDGLQSLGRRDFPVPAPLEPKGGRRIQQWRGYHYLDHDDTH